MFKKIKNIISILILLLLFPILIISGVIIANSYIYPDKVPSFLGWKPFIVLSGSMGNEILPGDLAIVKEIDTNKLKKNDIIAFKQDEIIVIHRIVDIIKEEEATKYITKGDSNNAEDRGYVLPEQVEGLYQFKISELGNLAMFIQTPIGMVSCLSIPLGLLLLVQMVNSYKNKQYIKENYNKEKDLQKEIEELKRQNEELQKK